MKPRKQNNGFALAPSKTTSGNYFIYQSTHYFFISDLRYKYSSEEGLNVYSAVTWGQFLSIKGLTTIGWMHTSSNVDVADMYAEKIVRKKTNFFMNMSQITACYRKNITINLENGKLVLKFKTYSTIHGSWLKEEKMD
jgi:acyl-homoserine lactone acylase PvdQ